MTKIREKAIKFEAEMYGVATHHYTNGFVDGYKQAIDELIHELKHNSTNISETGYQYHEYSDDELDEIAEQMKGEQNGFQTIINL